MNYYLALAFLLFLYMNAWFIISVFKKRNDVADVAWGLGFVMLAWTSFFLSNNSQSINILVNILISIWGFRLALHIYIRHKGKKEDSRYLIWRNSWGKWFYLRSYLQIFILQGIFLFIIAFPIMFINKNSLDAFNYLFLFGLLIWVIGFSFESIADKQLSIFIKNSANKGKLMQTGLWKYSRHPNYFGEITLWWGIWIIASSIPNGIYTIFSPISISILIIFISGIPLLEKKYKGRSDFEDYKKRTSILIPLPPRTV